MSSIRTVFMGTAPIACPSLRQLSKHGDVELLGVVTQPDRPKGRDLKLTPSAVKEAALELGLPVWQPEKARDPAFIAHLAALKPDLVVVVAYGQILPPSILELPRHGCLNLHTSLLPRHRGAAPIQWALLEGDAKTGVTIMKMDAGLDTGPMIASTATPIGEEDDAATLHDRLSELGAALLIETLPRYVRGELPPVPQDNSKSTYARKLSKEDGLIEWSLPARSIWCRIRAFAPWPGAFSDLAAAPNPMRVKVWRSRAIDAEAGTEPGMIVSCSPDGIDVACGNGVLRLVELQREGGRRMAAREFAAGQRLAPGVRFGCFK